MTVEETVKAWDAGETVWTVEMGGLGPNYELVIQILVMELLRDGELPDPGNQAAWSKWGEKTIARCSPYTHGFSGGQVMAAKNLAAQVLRHGWDSVFEQFKDDPDRKVMVSRHCPQPPPIPGAKVAA